MWQEKLQLNKIPITRIIHVGYLKYQNNFNSFRIFLILIFSLCHSFLSARDSIEHEIRQQVSIVMAKGAIIYSTEENFNKQILNKDIRLKGGDFLFNVSKKDQILIKSTASASSKKTPLKDQLQNAVKKKKKDEQDTVDKKIRAFEKQKELFHSHQFYHHPSSGQFLTVYQVAKDYIVPNNHHDNFSKTVHRYHNFLITSSLNYLHSYKYFHYNNKSLDYCYSQVYSVRPPPIV